MMSQKVLLPHPPGIDEEGGVRLYAIIDCAQLEEDFYLAATKEPNIVSRSLFIGTPHAVSAEAGPLLVQVDAEKDADFIEKILAIEGQKPAVVWLWSSQGFKPLCGQLRSLLFGELENGKRMFFRYYDPRCIEKILTVFKESEQAQKTLEHVQTWAYLQNGNYKYLTLSNQK